jgi:hypothetical protein
MRCLQGFSACASVGHELFHPRGVIRFKLGSFAMRAVLIGGMQLTGLVFKTGRPFFA